MAQFYLDPTCLDGEYSSDSESEWESILSEIPEWLEEADNEVSNEERQLISRSIILVIVSLIGIDVIIIVIEAQVTRVIVHYNRRTW
jgi:hypothetical protein